MRSSDVHDVDVTFAKKNDRVHFLEETLHGSAVARKNEVVAFEVAKIQIGERAHQRCVLRLQGCKSDYQSNGRQQLLHFQ